MTAASGSVVYSLQDDPSNFELSEEQFADGSQKIIYTGGLNESQVVVLIAVVSAVKTVVIKQLFITTGFSGL